ncbi:multiubiquitin domain-containing protein [Sphingomonas sp.]|jgi:sulfur carrier protein ThiS|uniref:multiubiquitin domain-containing protein n=1 Tax=Sphingomonas sp. TaxID=28214 RepID=UPI002DEB348D|nr:multiubiquitin domain-containing protein [Sphingomonas sp.]
MKLEDKPNKPDKPDPPKGSPEKKTVTIKVDGVEREVPKDKMTAADLKALLGIDPSQVLDEVDEDGTFKPLADTDIVKLRDGLVLVSHGRGGGSS